MSKLKCRMKPKFFNDKPYKVLIKDEDMEYVKGKTTFMLLSKCNPYYKHFGVAIHHPVLANFF